MTYQEAIDKSFTVKWKVGTCSQGEQCWCRTIEPIEQIIYKDGDTEDSYYITRSGEMLKKTAEYFVKLHNETFNTKREMKKKLKSLDEHNTTASTWNTSLYGNTPEPNGISCPKCGEELMDSNPMMTLTSHPAQKNVHCSSCDYKGYRIA